MKHLRSVFVLQEGGGRLRLVRLKPVWRAIRLQLLAARNPYFADRLLCMSIGTAYNRANAELQ